MKIIIVKVLLFVGTIFVVSTKYSDPLDSWIWGFKHYRQQSVGKLYFVGFYFHGLREPQNPRKLEPHDY